MKLSIIIVSYNAVDYLEKCLQSIRQSHFTDYEVIVYDNASPQREIEQLPSCFPEVKFILAKENIGFSGGNNHAIEQAQGEYILLLNPDTLLPPDFLGEAIEFISQCKNPGAVGPRMMDGNGVFHPESKRNVPTPENAFHKLFGFLYGKKSTDYYYTTLSEHENGEVPVLTGACLLLRRDVYTKVGGLDETYFMYGEDIDLCYTLLQHGFINYYMGEQTIVHYKGESTIKNQVYLKRFYGAMHIFLKKYYAQKSPLLYGILWVGLKIRYGLARLILWVQKQKN